MKFSQRDENTHKIEYWKTCPRAIVSFRKTCSQIQFLTELLCSGAGKTSNHYLSLTNLATGEFYLVQQIGLPSWKWHLWLLMKPLKCICKSIVNTFKSLGQSQWTLDTLALVFAQNVSLGKYLWECWKFDTSCDSLSKLDKSCAPGYKTGLLY